MGLLTERREGRGLITGRIFFFSSTAWPFNALFAANMLPVTQCYVTHEDILNEKKNLVTLSLAKPRQNSEEILEKNINK